MPNEISETFDQILQKELALLPGPQMWAIPQALVDSDRKFAESLKTSADPLETALWETFMATKPIPSPFNTAPRWANICTSKKMVSIDNNDHSWSLMEE